MKKLTILLLTSFPLLTMAQTTEETEKTAVINVVQQFFQTMDHHDTATAKKIVLMDCQLYSVQQTKDSIINRMRTFTDFLKVIGQTNRSLEEKVWNPSVMIHKQIAIVWAPYDFHLNGQLTHCGIDEFNLVKTNEGWKVASVMYTVEPDACVALQKKN